jgi:hypothetical protein
LKSRKAGLGGDANAFQSPMILQPHTATLKEIYQRGKGFTTIAGARRNNADQLTQRILPRVDFSIRIFHGHFRNKNVLWLDVTTRRFVQKFSATYSKRLHARAALRSLDLIVLSAFQLAPKIACTLVGKIVR